MPTPQPFTINKPWGEFRQYTQGGEPVTVKTISVKNGGALSLQFHSKRTEFWRVLSGNPTVTVGDQTMRAKAGDEFTILPKAIHRIAAENGDAEILEIARGDFDENDIVRVEDIYGRA